MPAGPSAVRTKRHLEPLLALVFGFIFHLLRERIA
jgi:hypothetical protein